jgi:[lysine-biosynthesis-protein LysW]--L-2-aminoadipate ligase
VGAIYRRADHWITNTARTGQAFPCPVTPAIEKISMAAGQAVGGGFLAVDLLEHPDGLLVNEINYTPEFRGFMEATGIEVADHLIDYVLAVGARSAAVA